jgi:WD40 repeat protein
MIVEYVRIVYIGVWAYNEETIQIIPDTASAAESDAANFLNEGVNGRVAGMSLKATLTHHTDTVAAIAFIENDKNHWMLTTGWDRRICIWNLKDLKFHDIFRNSAIINNKEELAADGAILSIEYCAERNEFGYSSADKAAYIRKFSPDGSEMRLVAVLLGHDAEVTQIKWNSIEKQWITGSEDRTLRIWPETGIPCLRVINNDGPVTALCIDSINGCLITGSQDKIVRVIDMQKKDEIVQKNIGHSDEIRSIIHISSRNQYVSAAWDNSVRVWNGNISLLSFFKEGTKTAHWRQNR